MQLRPALSRLPTSLVLLISAQIQASAAAAENEAIKQHPTAIRKMTFDEGEMIFPEYFDFSASSSDQQAQSPPNMLLAARSPILTPEEEDLLAANSSAILSFRPPFPIHQAAQRPDDTTTTAIYRRSKESSRDVLARLQGRDFSCPQGTSACTNIGESGYCCQHGTTCFVVKDAPNAGNVGCCPDGNQCSGGVGDCGGDSTGCAAEDGGGCCIEGFVCADAGCVASQQPTPTKTTTSTTTTPTPTTRTTTTSSSTTSSTTTTDDGGALPPVRPTGTSSSSSLPYCPTGYYACLAQDLYQGGCCRIGRDCATTSCPPLPPMTTITTDSAATVVVPISDVPTTTATDSACAGGWYGCGRDLLGGCCPSGYACGSASCTLTSGVSTATATVEVQKIRPGDEVGGAAGGKRQGLVAVAAGVMGIIVGWGML